MLIIATVKSHDEGGVIFIVKPNMFNFSTKVHRRLLLKELNLFRHKESFEIL